MPELFMSFLERFLAKTKTIPPPSQASEPPQLFRVWLTRTSPLLPLHGMGTKSESFLFCGIPHRSTGCQFRSAFARRAKARDGLHSFARMAAALLGTQLHSHAPAQSTKPVASPTSSSTSPSPTEQTLSILKFRDR